MAAALREPAYLSLHRSGELAVRAARARERLADCDLCARYCRCDRLKGISGAVCRTGAMARVHGFGPHFGEEDPLRGTRGSGTIFFSWCNLRCDFCQNWEISQRGDGVEVTDGELARQMLALEEEGCHNVNLVSPSHVVAQVLSALEIAAGRGLTLPIVWNTGGYDSPEALALLDGVVDIYMPDMKYADAEVARRTSHVPDYPKVNRAAVKEMHRQVGDLVLDAEGVAVRGLLVRHLVLPNGLAGTEKVLEFLAREISPDTYLNLMDQYHPAYRAGESTPLSRRLTREEWYEALALAVAAGLTRLDSRRRLPL
ncbi:MAG TPA: radical SAM protein [Thermoanaerobaculia bacterium]|nr:radical SAM protein [Thermoanaerobaculia bacterium]HQR65908.1 radical SAM protein [Thermoanaerobaculia bacterium]